MKLKIFLQPIKQYCKQAKTAFFFLKYKGFKYTYNYLWIDSFFRDNSLLKKIFLRRLFPYTVPSARFIEIETSTRCSLKCQMCEHTYWKESPKIMSFEQFKHVLDQFPKLKFLSLTGIGENFLNPDFMKILRHAKSCGIYVDLNDPFFFLDESRIKELIDIGLDSIVLSMDAATKETYEKLRVGSSFDRVIENIKSFIRLKREMGSFFPQLSVNFVINKENLHEVPVFLDLMHELGVDGTVRFASIVRAFKEIKELLVDVPDSLIKTATRRAEEHGIRLLWDKSVFPAPKQQPISACTNWIIPFIFVTGHVIPCCAMNEGNRRDFEKENSFGNVFETPFREIWNSQKYKDFRKAVHDGKASLQCVGCTLYNLHAKET